MIVLNSSQITRDASMFVVYDTGPDGTQGGQIKRLTFSELLHFPDPRWRPVRENSAFLGVFRWNGAFSPPHRDRFRIYRSPDLATG